MRLIKRGQNYKLGMFGLVLSCVFFSSVNAQRLTALDTVTLANGDVELRYRFDKNIQPPKSFYMKDKNLLVLDFVSTGVNQTLNSKTINNNVLSDVQNLYANNKVRSTARLKPDSTYTILNRNNEVVVTLSRATNFMIDQPKWENSVQSNIANLDVQQPVAKDVGFYRNSQGAGVVEVFLANDKTQVQLTDEQTRGVALSIPGTIWDAKQVRRIEVTDFATPVSALEVVNNNGTAMVRVRTQANYEFSSQQIGSKYQLIIKPKRQVVANDSKNRGLGQQEFTGDLISINFQDIDVRAILQIIADFTGLNIVVSDSVNSRITIRLQNVPWDQALDVVLRSKGLVQQRSGSVVYIVPKGEAIPEERDLITEVIQINNAKAVELATVLKSTSGSSGGELGRSSSAGLSQYGELTVDPNQNLLIVRDTPDQMRVVKELISHLDKPLRQVVISAQIVVTTDNFSRELGIKWKSLGNDRMGIDHNADGAAPIWSGKDAEFDFGGEPEGVMPKGFGSVWRQSSGFDGTAGTLGLAILRRGFNASLELSAMQGNGKGEVLASPTLMTTDRKEAFINEGRSVPYKTYADGATNTEFKDVVMELKVTPSITPDDNIILDINIKKDDLASFNVGEEPVIQKREIETQAIVRDGETVVLGGIYSVTSDDTITKVPFLGDLPYVGNFFKSTSNKNEKMEMVIFLTPNIVK